MSLFSGIEAATAAWHPLGWEPAAFAEIEPFPCAVLKEHYPDIPNLGDVTLITEEMIAALDDIDLVVFGSPCTDMSVAGKREGLDGRQSRLFYDAIRIVQYAREHCGCRFALWENVPGAFSTNKGRDFACVVGAMAGSEFGVPKNGWRNSGVAVGDIGMVEWCVLDAQYFGLAQQRKRVFALADFGDWAGRPPILLEPGSLSGNPPACGKAGKTVAALTSNGVGVCGADDNQGQAGHLIPETAACLTGRYQKGVDSDATDTLIAHTLCGEGFDASENGTGRGTPIIASTLTAGWHKSNGATGGNNPGMVNPVIEDCGVRRLTPVECERLQGFQDRFTDIQYRGKPAKDRPRYKAIGNSMAVPVMAWIGSRIDEIL